MEVCPLIKQWCSQCGGCHCNPACYFGGEIKRVKNLKACPRLPFKEERPK